MRWWAGSTPVELVGLYGLALRMVLGPLKKISRTLNGSAVPVAGIRVGAMAVPEIPSADHVDLQSVESQPTTAETFNG